MRSSKHYTILVAAATLATFTSAVPFVLEGTPASVEADPPSPGLFGDVNELARLVEAVQLGATNTQSKRQAGAAPAAPAPVLAPVVAPAQNAPSLSNLLEGIVPNLMIGKREKNTRVSTRNTGIDASSKKESINIVYINKDGDDDLDDDDDGEDEDDDEGDDDSDGSEDARRSAVEARDDAQKLAPPGGAAPWRRNELGSDGAAPWKRSDNEASGLRGGAAPWKRRDEDGGDSDIDGDDEDEEDFEDDDDDDSDASEDARRSIVEARSEGQVLGPGGAASWRRAEVRSEAQELGGGGAASWKRHDWRRHSSSSFVKKRRDVEY